MSTIFYKSKLVEGMEDNAIALTTIDIKQENDYWKSKSFLVDNYLNCTFYNKKLKRYQINLISNEIFKNLQNELKAHFLTFCNNNSKKENILDSVYVLPITFVSGCVVASIFIIKKFPTQISYVENIYTKISVNKLLSIGLSFSNEGITKNKISANTVAKLTPEKAEEVKVGNLIQNCAIKTTTSAQELKFQLMKNIDGHGSNSQDDTVCNYANNRNILSKILS